MAFRFALLYWVASFVFSSILWGAAGTDPIESALGKLTQYAICALVTFGIAEFLARQHADAWKGRRQRSLAVQTLLCFVLALLAAPVYCLTDFIIYAWKMWPYPAIFDWKEAGYNFIFGAALFFGWSSLFLTLLYSFDARDRERRLAALREEALAAQMRALRYQVNPHFLFNTLNSVACLIEEGDAVRAERMVLSLSAFLRATLSLDPMHDVPLADELALQEEYLEIERERFSDRMAFTIDAPEEVLGALVPSLILQPLIENAIKHGVSAMAGKVEIALQARRDAGRLQITVENDMPAGTHGARRAGMGVGLRNVAERVRARFDGDGHFSSGPVSAGRFRASLDLPWRHK